MSEKFKVLIAYDGSGFADAALDDLNNAGLPEHTEALIFSVAEVWLPPQKEGEKLEFVTETLKRKHEESLEIFAKAKETANRAAERVRASFPNWNIASEATYGSPAWEILSRAEDLAADLIIVGAQGVHGLDAILIGSIAQKIVTEASCSVRVARGKIDVNGSPTRIIVGYDGSAGADAAIEAVARRNWKVGSEAKIVIVEDTAVFRRSFEIEDEKIEEVKVAVVKKLESDGLKASLVIKEGNPKSIVVEEAENWDADCVFIGATKYNDVISKYLLGSVSSAIVTRAKCTVEVVRPKTSKV